MGEVSEGKATVQHRGVGDLKRVARFDQLGGRAAGDPGARAEIALRRLPCRGHHAPSAEPVNRVGAPPLTKKTWGPRTGPARHLAISAAIAFAPNTGSRNTPSDAATNRAAAAPSGEGTP